MDGYIRGALRDLEARAKYLKSQLRPSGGRCSATLLKTCRDKLDVVSAHARALREDSTWQSAGAAGARFRAVRLLVVDMDELEYVGVQVLLRWQDIDVRANELLDKIASEINYPLATPVVACQSRNYFRIYPELSLLLIPPAEGAFLLHLPDLYHELAHPLLLEVNDSKFDPLQQTFMRLWSNTQTYVYEELQREDQRRSAPQALKRYLEGWRESWRFWLTEFFCDIFAAHTLGPAFAWAHLHLTAKRGKDPFAVPLGSETRHPADAARFDIVLEVLKSDGWTAEVALLEQKWRALMSLGGYNATPEYTRCFPKELLAAIAILFTQAVVQIGCPAPAASEKPVGQVLNEAWTKFWHDPDGYADWQENEVRNLGLLALQKSSIQSAR